MPNPDLLYRDKLGFRVTRAAAALPQTSQHALFTITGGRVLLTELVGEVTVTIQTQADATKVVFNPTVGADQDLSGTLDITADAVGTVYGIAGNAFNTAMLGAGPAKPGQVAPVVLGNGSIDLNCAASNTGQVKWTAYYIPIDPGARLA